MDQRQFVKVLRRDMTEAERRLWFHLRAHRFVGQKFRRQQALGPYVVDFVHFAARLIVEADGSQHGESRRDWMRDAWLTNHGFRVSRFWNDEVLQRTDAVLETIAAALQEAAVSSVTRGDAVQLTGASWQSRAVALAQTAPSPPAPLPRGAGGESNSLAPVSEENILTPVR